MPTFKARVLFFHGYAQSALIFYAKSSALRKKLMKMGYKCVYLNGPDRLNPAEFPSNDVMSKFNTITVEEGKPSNLRGWWMKSPNDNTIHIDKAIDTIKQYVNENKVIEEDDEDFKQDITKEDEKLPIVGVIGFSQGAGLIGLLMSKFKELFNIDLQFAILYSGFKIETHKGSVNEMYDSYYKGYTGDYKVLHVIGELDTVVSEERTMNMYKCSQEISTLLSHPGGHFVPNSKLYVEKVTNWILSLEQEEQKEPNKKDDDLDDLLNMMDSIGKA